MLFFDKGLRHHNHTRTAIFHSLFEERKNAQISKTAHLQADFAIYMQAAGADLYSSQLTVSHTGMENIPTII